jgi:acetyl-CoA acyltransferase
MPEAVILSAVATAAGSIRSGMDELIIVGGVSSGSTAPRERVRAGEEWADWFSPTHPDRPDAPNRDMSLTIGWSAAVTAGVSREEMEGFSITAGNACGSNDGAAALVIASDTMAAELGRPPLAVVRSWASVGVDPAETWSAPVKAIPKAPEKVNVNGSGCSLGHPIAATGGRMLSTLVHQLRRQGGGIGVAAMCVGGGMGGATVIEVLAP